MKIIKYMMYTVLTIIGSVILYALFQAFLYWYEDGLRVADSAGGPALSESFYVYQKPIGHFQHIWPLFGTRSPINFFDKWAYWRAMRKFPTIKECLTKTGRDNTDLEAFNWKSMRTGSQAEICLHHASVELGDPEKVATWLKQQGFDAEYDDGWTGDWFQEKVEAYWSYKRHGTYFPFSRLSLWGLIKFSPFVRDGISIHYYYNRQRLPAGYPIETQIIIGGI